jgi:uncharacterized membrane protein YcaP (DUF421 family)
LICDNRAKIFVRQQSFYGANRILPIASGKFPNENLFTGKERMQQFYDAIEPVLGLERDPKDLTLGQIALRAFIVFIVALIMVRLGDRRFLSKKTAFDAILGFILASMLARAVNGSAAFFSTLAGGFLLVGLHRLIALLSRHSHKFGTLVKGRSDLIIRNGAVQQSVMDKNDFTERDLLEDLRLNGRVENPDEVKTAYLERNGQVSVVPQKK